MLKYIIAVDGLAGSGKTSVCSIVSKQLGWLHISTGIFYRAFAFVAHSQGVDIRDEKALQDLIDRDLSALEWRFDGNSSGVYYDGVDISSDIEGVQIGRLASIVSEFGVVRTALLTVQRQSVLSAQRVGAIIDGRDIGTVIFPAADLKIFMVADLRQRAIRWAADEHRGTKEMEIQIKERDLRDETRVSAPMKRAEGAIELDTTDLTAGQAAEKMLALIGKNLNL